METQDKRSGSSDEWPAQHTDRTHTHHQPVAAMLWLLLD